MRSRYTFLKISCLILSFLTDFTAFGQQNGILKGVILTSDGQGAPSVAVALENTSKGDITDSRGAFELRNIRPGNYTLVTSFVGLQTQRVEVIVSAGETTELPSIILHEDAQELNEIIISGAKTNPFQERESEYVSKLPLENLENAQVYSTITNELLTQQLVFSVEDAVRNAPGLQKMWEATGRGGDGGAYYNSRGFILQSQLRNGVAGNVTSRIDAANIESIEVIKGPSATLFGSTLSSYGGLINRVTKKPYETFGGELAYSTGSFGFNRISLDINTPLDKSKDVLFRLNTAYNYQGSWQDNGFEKGYVIAPVISYKLNERLSITFDAELYSGSNTGRPFIFFYYPAPDLGVSRADELGIDYDRAYSANDLFQVSKSNNFFLQANYKISDAWTSQTNFTSTYSFSDGPLPYYYLVPNSVVTGDPTATGSDYLTRAVQATSNSEMNVKEFQQNFIGDFTLGNIRNRMVIGLNVFTQNSNQLFYGMDFDIIPKSGVIPNYEKFNRDKLDSALQNGAPWTWPYRFKTNTLSAYVSDVVNLTDNLIASVGLRIDHFDNKGSYNMASGEYTGDYTQTALSPKFGLVYQPVNKVLALFANYQSGFRNVNGTDYEGKTFTPEQANQVEVGVKADAFSGRLTTTLSYYDITVRDMVRPYAENPNFSIQDGTQHSQGVEFELIANPVAGLNIVAGLAYNESKYEKSEDDVQGRRPTTAMSPFASNLWISYQLRSGAMQGFGAGFGGNYASDNKILNSNYYGEFVLPAYTVLNATLFYEQPKFRIGVKVDNLSNKQYWIGYTTMNPQRPRSVVGSISFKF
jgi:iron complex outermembrane receptor protein